MLRYLQAYLCQVLQIRQVLLWKLKVNRVLLHLLYLYHKQVLLFLQGLLGYLFHRLLLLRILRHPHIHLAQVSLSQVQRQILFRLLHHRRLLDLVLHLRRNLILSLLCNLLHHRQRALFHLYHLKPLILLYLRFLPRHRNFLILLC